MSLPNLPAKDNYRREVRTEWGGINLNENAGDGELIEAMNMSSREYPLLATEWIKPDAAPVEDALMAPYMYGGRLGYIRIYQTHDPVDCQLYNPTDKGPAYIDVNVTPDDAIDGRVDYAQLGDRMCIFPAKQVYDFTYGTLSNLEESLDSLYVLGGTLKYYYLCSFQDGTIGGVPAEMNTIWCPGADWEKRFRVGDAVTIEGTQYNNKTAIIREIDGDYLRFSENAFTEELTPGLYYDYPSYMSAGEHYTMMNGSYYTWTIISTIYNPVHLTVVKLSGLDRFFVSWEQNGEQIYAEMVKTDTEPEGAAFVTFSAVGQQYIDLPNGLVSGGYHYTLDGANYYSFTTSSLPAGIKLQVYGSSLKYDYGNPPRTITIATIVADPPLGTELTVELEDYHAVISRTVPDMDFVCVNENRVWGCKGDTIYCSKLGDPYNWNVFDGLSTDSWAVETGKTGTPGDFTGCCSYQGYPTFFKENVVFKVLGDTPQNFVLRKQNIVGVAKGCHRSIVEIRGQLYYVSEIGAVAWNGGDYPSIISHALGSSPGTLYVGDIAGYCTAGTDGLRYFLSTYHVGYQRQPQGEIEYTHAPRTFVYDTRFGTWNEISWRGAGTRWPEFAYDGMRAYMLGHTFVLDGEDLKDVTTTYLLSGPEVWNRYGPEEWRVTFADSTRAYKTALTGSESKKGVLRLLIRCRLAGSMKVWIAYDGGQFEQAAEFGGDDGLPKTSKVVPLILRRCDFWQLRLTGTGDAVIYSIAVEKYGGEWQQA